MSEEETSNVKTRILSLFADLDDVELDSIEHWISSQSYKNDLKKMKSLDKSKEFIKKISYDIRKLVPLGGELSTEMIVPPTVGDQSDCTKQNTCSVDEFLYDDEAVDELVKKEKLSRHYCVDCNSRNVKELIFVSHSMSINLLHFLYKVLLPKELDGKQLLDIGSRFGAIIFSAYHLTNASTIIGVEMNKECCDVQEKIKNKFSMDSKRIRIENNDIMDRKDLVENSNVIVINVIDFFVDNKKHIDIWYFLKDTIKKGTYIVTNRSMRDTLDALNVYEHFIDWLSICKPFQLENEILFDIEDFDTVLYLYVVN